MDVLPDSFSSLETVGSDMSLSASNSPSFFISPSQKVYHINRLEHSKHALIAFSRVVYHLVKEVFHTLFLQENKSLALTKAGFDLKVSIKGIYDPDIASDYLTAEKQKAYRNIQHLIKRQVYTFQEMDITLESGHKKLIQQFEQERLNRTATLFTEIEHPIDFVQKAALEIEVAYNNTVQRVETLSVDEEKRLNSLEITKKQELKKGRSLFESYQKRAASFDYQSWQEEMGSRLDSFESAVERYYKKALKEGKKATDLKCFSRQLIKEINDQFSTKLEEIKLYYKVSFPLKYTEAAYNEIRDLITTLSEKKSRAKPHEKESFEIGAYAIAKEFSGNLDLKRVQLQKDDSLTEFKQGVTLLKKDAQRRVLEIYENGDISLITRLKSYLTTKAAS